MKTIQFSCRLLSGLVVGCLAVVLAACGSNASSGTTVGAGTSPTTTAPQATTVPTRVASPTTAVTASPKLNVAIECGGTKQGGYGVDVIHGKVCAQTLPGAILTIRVIYCAGQPDPSSVLQGSVMADARGFYQWSWMPHPDCKGQPIWEWQVTVMAQLHGQTATASQQGMA